MCSPRRHRGGIIERRDQHPVHALFGLYSPLIATIAGGFLKEEGLQPKHSVAPAGKSAIEGLLNGTARAWIVATAKIAEAEAPFFPEIDRAVLTATLAYYQRLGCWTPHVEITRPAFEVALDVFQHSRLITKRHRYEDVVAAPPDAA